MKSAVVNKQISLSYPEEFHVMDDEEMVKTFGDKNEKRWVIRNDDRHITISVFWFKPYMFVTSLWDAKAVAKKAEDKLKKAAKGCNYKCEGFFTRQICGQEAHGFRYEYILRDKQQSGEVVALKVKNTCYTIYYYVGNPEDPDEQKVFEDILESIHEPGLR